jgi:hypothetical protein
MTPEEFFGQLDQFTKEAYQKLKIDYTSGDKKTWNNYGPYTQPTSGHVMHYTASADSPSRLTNIMTRFRVNQWIMKNGRKQAGVGIAFAIFDKFDDRLADVRKNYPRLYGPNGLLHGDILHWGLETCWYSSNWANKWTHGTEIRNAGKLGSASGWKGRTPVQVRGMLAEPFTDGQILDSVQVCRNLKAVQGENFKMVDFMSHHLIHPNKWDAWPHYPFGRVKRAICTDTEFSLDNYIEELNDLSCPKVVDEDTAETFLVTMGYLMRPVDPDNMAMKKYLDEDVPTAITYLQKKKDIKATGKLNDATLKAMEAVRRAYKL